MSWAARIPDAGNLISDSEEDGQPVGLAARTHPRCLKPISTFMYVDDTTTVEEVDKDTTVKHFTSEQTKETVPAPATEAAMSTIIRRAGDIGMVVNCICPN